MEKEREGWRGRRKRRGTWEEGEGEKRRGRVRKRSAGRVRERGGEREVEKWEGRERNQ